MFSSKCGCSNSGANVILLTFTNDLFATFYNFILCLLSGLSKQNNSLYEQSIDMSSFLFESDERLSNLSKIYITSLDIKLYIYDDSNIVVNRAKPKVR